jgi:hypothetical protein
MLMGAMVSMSYELSTPPVHTNPSSVATRPKRARKSDGTSERVKRFTRLSPSTQEKVLAYGENLLKYYQEPPRA